MSQSTLIEEIKQITSQYNAEVGRDRKAWPNSIRDRVATLLQMGVKASAITRQTGVPYFTVLKWRPSSMKGAPRGVHASRTKFKELAVIATREARCAEAVAVRDVAPALDAGPRDGGESGTVTVTTLKGFRIEVQNFETAIRLIRELGVE